MHVFDFEGGLHPVVQAGLALAVFLPRPADDWPYLYGMRHQLPFHFLLGYVDLKMSFIVFLLFIFSGKTHVKLLLFP